jgi:hypothetical protein
MPGGGHVQAGTLGVQPSARAATAALLHRVHAIFGARPTVIETATNPAAHAVAVFFRDTLNGRPYTGMAVVQAAPGAQAAGVVLYDTSARFPSSIGPMLRRVGAMTGPSAGAGTASLAPAEPLVHHDFTDGTGSIDVPADWRLASAGGGSASVLGPTGEIVSYDLAVNAMDPNNRMAVNYLRGLPPQFRQQELKRTAIIAYTDDPAQAWTTVFRQIARQNGRPAPAFTIDKVTSLSSGNVRLDEISGRGTIPNIPGKADDAPGKFIAFVQVLPPNTMGQWSMISSWLYIPDAEFARMGRTTGAVMASVRINFAAVAAQAEATRKMFQRTFDTMIANARAQDAARRENNDRFLAADRAAQEGMHKQAVAMENFAGDRMVVRNVTTGDHSTLDSGFAGQLVQNDRDYEVVKPSELLRGVDY